MSKRKSTCTLGIPADAGEVAVGVRGDLAEEVDVRVQVALAQAPAPHFLEQPFPPAAMQALRMTWRGAAATYQFWNSPCGKFEKCPPHPGCVPSGPLSQCESRYS